MKTHFLIFALIAGGAVHGVYAQQTTDQLVIDTAIDYIESGVDRTVMGVDGIIQYAVDINNAGASYTGTNVNITFQGSGESLFSAISLLQGKSISLTTSGEGVRNTFTVASDFSAQGIGIEDASAVSYISRTDVNTDINGSSTGILCGMSVQSSVVVLDDVNFHQSNSGEAPLLSSFGIVTQEGATVTGGQVTITSAPGASIGAISVEKHSTVDLHDATITIASVGGGFLPYGVLTLISSVEGRNTISLTDSSIASANGNLLISDFDNSGGEGNVVNLNNVNLDDAKEQVIRYYGDLEINLSNGTNLDGYTVQFVEGTGTLDLNIISGSSWHVTQSSTLGVMGSLTLDGTSAIMFDQVSPGLFTDITSALITLDSGAELMLGIDAASLQALLDANGGEYDVKLFTTDQAFSNDGVVLVTSDGQVFQYTTDNLGTYTLLGVTIPEPTTVTLGFAALGLMVFRRRTPECV